MKGLRFELPEDTKRRIDLAGEVLELERLISKRENNPDSCLSVTEAIKQKLSILKRRLGHDRTQTYKEQENGSLTEKDHRQSESKEEDKPNHKSTQTTQARRLCKPSPCH